MIKYFYLLRKYILYILKISRKNERLMYRQTFFEQLKKELKNINLDNLKILEIGPKDGLDSIRLQTLKPKEIIFIDLPEKNQNLKWMDKINCKTKLIQENIMYMNDESIKKLGKFKIIYCLGVLYHNPEQLRMIKKLYNLLEVGGLLCLESAVIRDLKYKFNKDSIVKIYFPKKYRNTRSITHLPNKNAINSWLKMSGFEKIKEIQCYNLHNPLLINQRYACIAYKSDEKQNLYYQAEKQNYIIGESS